MVTSRTLESQTVEASPVKRGDITESELLGIARGTSNGRAIYILEVNGQPAQLVALRPVQNDVAEALAILVAQKK
jgi:hypothetical protein